MGVVPIKYVLEQSSEGIKIGPFGSTLTGKVSSEHSVKVYGQWNVIGKDFTAGKNYVTEETYKELESYWIHPNDVLISMMGTVGKCAIIPNDVPKGIMDSHIVKVRLNENLIDPQYFYYVYDKDGSKVVMSQIQRDRRGSIMDGLNSSLIKGFLIPLPSLSEQHKIVSFLEYKVGQIDSVIAEKEKMLEDLKIYRSSVISEAVTKGLDKNVPMKDSGIDCLGSVPKHWRVTRLKFIADNYDGTHFSPETREFGMPYITAGDIRGKGINYDSAKKISQEDYCRLVEQGCKIEKGDVLLVKDGATTGRVGLMTDETECVALSSVAMLRPHDNIDSLFLMYYMESYSMQTQIANSMAGSAMPRITLTKLNEFIVNVPPIKEQKVITSFIDNEVEQIDIITIEIEKEIEDLKSYKSSVITEAVTGKVDLREWNKQIVTA